MIKLPDYSRSAATTIKSLIKQIQTILVLPVLVFFIVISCEDDPASIGRGMLPQSDFDSIVATDTMRVDMYTLFSDSVTSMQPTVSYLGNVLDPYFGLTGSDFVTQLWIAAEWAGDGFTVDSVKIKFEIKDIIGEMVGSNTLNIYELSEKLSADSSYLASNEVQVKDIMASLEVPPLPEGSDTVLYLDLPVSFAEYLLRDTSILYLRSDTVDWRDFFYGLYFEYPQISDYHMLQLNLVTPSSTDNSYASAAIIVYYTNGSGYDRTYTFTINPRCLLYNRFLHDFEKADPDKRIKYINEPIKDTLAYVQSMEGVYSKMVIPGLEYLRSLPYDIAINKARIYLPVYFNETDYTEDMVPDNIYVRYDSAGVKRILTDYLIDPAFLDGSYNQVTNLYRVNISNFVQNYFEGKIEEPVIEIFLPELSTKNLIIKANRETEDAVRFELSYTVLKEQ
ncbi:MAG: DUF4270 family protein [Bacteroidales bacterium]|nr:DUF4270 family protein [Bacteroidales bacterium]